MKPRFLSFAPRTMIFAPLDPAWRPVPQGEPVYINPDELEAFKLVYYENLKQEEAASRMGVSRGTLWRCLESARKKIATALVEQRALVLVEEETE